MSERQFQCVVIHEAGFISTTALDEDLHTFRDIIGCGTVDIVRRYIDNAEFWIVCDDEGAIRGRAPTMLSAIDPNSRMCAPVIVGTAIIGKLDAKGEGFRSLSKAEIAHIYDNRANLCGRDVICNVATRPARLQERCRQ